MKQIDDIFVCVDCYHFLEIGDETYFDGVYEPEMADQRIYECELGITRLVSVVGTNVTGIRRMLYQFGDARIIAQLGGGDVQIFEETVRKGSFLVGKKPEIKNAVIATIYRQGELIIPKDDTIIKEGDVLLAAVKTKDLSAVADAITGK